MSFDPNASFTFAGLPWQFDTPQAYQSAAAAAANTESGRFDYNLGLGSGWDPSLLSTIGYTGAAPAGGTFYSGANSESGRNDYAADAQQAAAQQSLQDYLTQKGYYLGTTYGTAGPGGFWNSGGSPEIQMFFDSNGNPVGKPAVWGGNDTMLQAVTPIIMALTAGMGGEIAGAGGQAAGGAAGSVEGGGSGAALGSAEGSASGAFNPAGFTGQGFGQIPIQASNLGASMGNIGAIGKTVIGGGKSMGGAGLGAGGNNYVSSLADSGTGGSMGDEFSLDPSIFGSGVGSYGAFDPSGFGGTYGSGQLPSIDYTDPNSILTQYGSMGDFSLGDFSALGGLAGGSGGSGGSGGAGGAGSTNWLSTVGQLLKQNPGLASLGVAGLASLFGGGSSSGSFAGAGPKMYTPTGLSAADQNWQQQMGANQGQLGYGGGLAGLADPALLQSFQQAQGINYQPFLNASQQAGQQYGSLADRAGQMGNLQQQQAQFNYGQQGALSNAGQQVWQTALDPQRALYDRTRQQVLDNSAALSSMYGLGSSAAGAGMSQQALNNFDIDWQNQQLARQQQGLQAYQGASQVGGQLGLAGNAGLQQSLNFYGQQPGYTQQSAQVPMQAQQYAAQQPGLNAQQYASGLGSAMQPYWQMQNQSIPYMNYGSGAGANAFNANLNQQGQKNQQYQQLGQTIGGIDWGQVGQGIKSIFNPAPGG